MEILFFVIVLLMSVTIHEVSHGVAALLLGDPTAKRMGRLTLNPIPHLDPVGSILMPAITILFQGAGFPMIAWAKPVPFNPYNLRLKRWGPAITGLAGPLSNFVLAGLFATLIFLLPTTEALLAFKKMLAIIAYVNIMLGVFNLVPIPPLDGSRLVAAIMPGLGYEFEAIVQRYGVIGFVALLFILFQFVMPLIAPVILAATRLMLGDLWTLSVFQSLAKLW